MGDNLLYDPDRIDHLIQQLRNHGSDLIAAGEQMKAAHTKMTEAWSAQAIQGFDGAYVAWLKEYGEDANSEGSTIGTLYRLADRTQSALENAITADRAVRDGFF